METLFTTELDSPYGKKELTVMQGDLMTMTDRIDLLTISAFRKGYDSVGGTMIAALRQTKGIYVRKLAKHPETDLRETGDCWISKPIATTGRNPNIRRIGCIEFADPAQVGINMAEQVLTGIHGYYLMLDFYTTFHQDIETVVMPLVGGGKQNISGELTAIPLLREAVSFLRRNPTVRRLVFADLNEEKAMLLAKTAEHSYAVDVDQLVQAGKPERSECVFICHSSKDAQIADLLAQRLAERGIRTWYSPESIRKGSYASAIVDGISSATHFVVIVSKNSMSSEHVLNEIDLAFSRLQEGLWLLPFRVDEEQLSAGFRYYLGRQEWMNAAEPPIDRQLRLFLDRVFGK